MGKCNKYITYLSIAIITFILTIINVKAIKVTKYYNIDCCKAMDEITIYEATGKIDLNDKQMGLELKSVKRNNKYYITLSGTPTINNGKVHFTGMTKDNDTIEVNYDIDVTVGRETITVNKTYNATQGTPLGNILVYESKKTLSSISQTRNGVTIKTANVNGKYGIYITGTPQGAGKITFTGTTYDDGNSGSNNTYDVSYNVVINVAAKQRETIDITKSYNGTVGKSIGNILVYQANGSLGNINSTKNGLTIKTDKDGLKLSGTPTQAGVITFSGGFTDGDDYQVTFSVTVTIPNPSKTQYKVEKLFNAVVNKDIGKVLIYESSTTLPDLNKTEKGVTLKTETVDGKTKIYLTGKPTEDGKVIFSGTIDEGNRDIVYYIIVTIEKNNNSNSNNNSNNSSNNTNNNSGNNNSNNSTEPSNNTNNDDNKAVDPIIEPNKDNKNNSDNKNNEPTNNTNKETNEENETKKEKDILLPAIIGVAALLMSLVVISSINKKKKA